MQYQIQGEERFRINMTETSPDEGITILHLAADAEEGADKLAFTVRWQIPDFGVHTTWAPGKYKNKDIVPNWGNYEASCAMSWAPVYAAVSGDDRNCQTIACADVKNAVRIHIGAIEENGRLDCAVKIRVDYAVSHYETKIRIDSRSIPFYQAIDGVRRWWEDCGYAPAFVPKEARLPVYSTWYSYHQKIDVPAILEECRFFGALGCKTLIVDDGWQTDNTQRGYDYCGDWQPVPEKVPDMKAFVDAVHEAGMKFVLWYSVPFVGEYSQAYRRFQDQMLYRSGSPESKTWVVDPRYPQIREYLIGLYRQAVLDWDLDGFKLDFVDAFVQSDVVKEGMDYTSVFDAVDRLMKDVIDALRAMKPDILIEFRQSYMGPLMRTFGNMIRSGDCPLDSWTNGQNVLSLRMTSGETAVHSDMVMWHEEESPQQAAFQLTRVLFSVPQISVCCQKISAGQAEMVKHYLAFWTKYRETLLSGEMLYRGYAHNYLYVSARSEALQVGAVYAGRTAWIEVPTEEIVLVNAAMDSAILIEAKDAGEYSCSVYDCCGRQVGQKQLRLDGLALVEDVPVNGTVVLQRL